MKIVFIGKDGIYSAAPIHKLAGKHEIVGVARSAPRSFTPFLSSQSLWPPRLRRLLNRRTSSTLLPVIAADLAAPVFELKKGGLTELTSFIKSLAPDLICVASMSQLLPRAAIDAARYGAINIHPSPLPAYRGPNPWFWQYHNGEPEGGLTIHRIDEGSDTGPILAQRSYTIEPGTTFSEMLVTTARLSSELILEAAEAAADPGAGRLQKHLPCPFYARRTTSQDRFVEWTNWPIERAWHFLRGAHRFLAPSWELPTLLRFVPWTIGGFERAARVNESGKFGKDGAGFYLGHSEGKIRVRLNRRG